MKILVRAFELAPISAGVVCFALAIYFAFNDRVAAGTLMSGLFVVCVLFYYLPQMEYFKAYGVEAKMRARLNEADELLQKIRRLAVVAGKLTYHTLGWQSRLAHPVREKQSLADDVDEVLSSMGVPGRELSDMKSNYIHFILVDLHWLFANQDSTDKRLQVALANIGSREKERIENLKERLKLVSASRRIGAPLRQGEDFREACERVMPEAGGLDETDANLLRDLMGQLCTIAEECVSKGRLTPEAAEMIENQGRLMERFIREQLGQTR